MSYLEDFFDKLTYLPTDVNRYLRLIKDLDRMTEGLTFMIFFNFMLHDTPHILKFFIFVFNMQYVCLYFRYFKKFLTSSDIFSYNLCFLRICQ